MCLFKQFERSKMASPQNPIKAALRLRIKALMALMTPENRREQSTKIADKVYVQVQNNLNI